MHRLLYTFLLLAASCDRGPPVPTDADNAQLNDAANLLDTAPEALNETDPARATGPQ